jgi:hypothetical protein
MCVVQAQGNTYTTNFPAAENPISEGGRWINGQAAGVDWANVRTVSGRAYGTESGSTGYDDSTAVLAGTWSPDQAAQGTVYTVNQLSGNTLNEEIELRLRTTITSHRITGYEINCRARHDGSQYVEIVRWNGALGDFAYVSRIDGGPGLFNGDVVKATMVGTLITVYINGNQVLTGNDSTFATGSPGMGFFIRGSTNLNNDIGFTSFTAWDLGARPPAAPTNLKIIPSLQ